jgi:HEAT repeat protein
MSDDDADASDDSGAAAADPDAAEEQADTDAAEEQADTDAAEEQADAPEDADTESADDAPADESGDTAASLDADTIEAALDDAADSLETADTEAALDDIEAEIDGIESDIEAADLPAPDDEDEDGPQAALEDRLGELRDQLEEARGPYAEDVTETVGSAKETITDTRWTESGAADAVSAVETFLAAATEHLDSDLGLDEETVATAATALETAASAIEDAGFDPDADSETIAALVAASETLTEGLEAAEEWDDLSVREQLEAEGFYAVLDHHKDFPPEWSALKEWEQRGRTDMIVLAYEQLDSEFMEEHCLEALKRLGDPAAYDAIAGLVDRREFEAIAIAGKMGTEEPLETLIEYAGEDGDPNLQLVSLQALGEIGSETATQAVADQLAADDQRVRSRAARALGLIGDTRAIAPLAETLDTDAADEVRASAAWALNQIGTERALDAVGEYADDEAYIVQAEARKAA